MAPLRVLIGVTSVLAFLAGRNTTTVSPAVEPVIELREISELIVINDPASRPQVDMYGNRIDQAIGDYRVDPRGDLYERHAPDTAVLKLGPPVV